MKILIDSSVWIDYFKTGNNNILDLYIDQNLIVINDLILAELIPFLKLKRQIKLIEILNKVEKLHLDIHWVELINVQTKCLKKGINGIGIPDLIIAQNVVQNNCRLFSLLESAEFSLF